MYNKHFASELLVTGQHRDRYRGQCGWLSQLSNTKYYTFDLLSTLPGD